MLTYEIEANHDSHESTFYQITSYRGLGLPVRLVVHFSRQVCSEKENGLSDGGGSVRGAHPRYIKRQRPGRTDGRISRPVSDWWMSETNIERARGAHASLAMIHI